MEAVKKTPAKKRSTTKSAPKLTIDKQFEEVSKQLEEQQQIKARAKQTIQEAKEMLANAEAGILQCSGALAALKPFITK